jgi:hypothetical protein
VRGAVLAPGRRSRATWYPHAPARTQGEMQRILTSCRAYPRMAGDKLSRCIARLRRDSDGTGEAGKAEGATDTRICTNFA